MKNSTRVALALGSALATLTLLAACGAGSSNDAFSARSANTAGKAGSLGAPSSASAPGLRSQATEDLTQKLAPAGVGATASAGSAPADAAAAAAPDLQPAVIRTGSITMTAPDPAAARQDILGLVSTLRGTVASEQSGSDAHGHLDQVDLSLRVPSASFDHALDGIRGYGTVLNLQQSAQDVTTQVIDVAARVRAQAASVASIQQLLARATTIGQVMSIESVLSSRQATLDSLIRQQKYLADQTSMSTIAVTLSKPAPRPPKPVKHVKHTGFIGGLYGGWHALGLTAVAVGAAVGAVLPFAALIVVLAVPVLLVIRGRRRTVSAN